MRGLVMIGGAIVLAGLGAAAARGAEDGAQEQASGDPVYYRAIHQPMSDALHDVADAFDFSLRSRNLPDRRLSGVYHLKSPGQFLRVLEHTYALDWHIADRTIFVSPRALRVERRFGFKTELELEEFRVVVERHAHFEGVRFPIRMDQDGFSMFLSGSPDYLDQVARLQHQYALYGHAGHEEEMMEEAALPAGRGVMVFRLENAWAADKTYRFKSSSHVVPGVATLLRQLTAGGNPAPAGSGKSSPDSPEATVSSTSPEAAVSSSSPGAADSPAPPKAAVSKAAFRKPAILADVRLNAVLVHDNRSRRVYYQNLIRELDRKSRLVEIQALVVDIARNRISDLGIDWRAVQGRNSIGFGDVGDSLTSGSGLAASVGQGSVATAISSGINGLIAKIRFLETQGDSRIVTSPSVMTIENLEAVINSTDQFFIRVSGFQDSSLHPVEVGTTMRVTPQVIQMAAEAGKKPPPPRIQLFVSIEDGSVDNSEGARIDNLPRIQQNSITTQAIVDQGGSLLIGGHIHTVSTRSDTRVPILGYIPILSLLFRRQEEVEREFVRMFIIRPQVRD